MDTLQKDFKALVTEVDGHDGEIPESMLEVRKGPFHCSVTPADFMRMEIETLRPKTLIDAIEAKYRQGPGAETGYTLALYQDEHRLWN